MKSTLAGDPRGERCRVAHSPILPGSCTWNTSREDCKVCKGAQALQERYQPRAEEHAHAGPTGGASQVTRQGDAGAPREASWHLSCHIRGKQGVMASKAGAGGGRHLLLPAERTSG